MQRLRLWALPLFACACLVSQAQRVPLALTADPPPNRLHPATMVSIEIPSHGEQLNGILYIAAGAGLHPAAILLHGFPGNEKNLDLAQAMRRDGWNVLYFDYRGSWGSPGAFSFEHCVEDTEAVIDFLRDPGIAAELRTDRNRIVLIGHSLGGFLAAYGAAHDPSVLGIVMISAANLGGMSAAQGDQAVAVPRLSAHFARDGLEALQGCSPQSLARETVTHRTEWNFDDYGPQLATRPVLLITSDDGLAEHSRRFANVLRGDGNDQVTIKHFASDHSYSSVRIGLEIAVLNWLDGLPKQ